MLADELTVPGGELLPLHPHPLGCAAPPPARPYSPPDQQVHKLNAPGQAAYGELETAEAAAAATPARIRLGDLAPDIVRLDAETKQITHAIRMAACNAETIRARALAGTTLAPSTRIRHWIEQSYKQVKDELGWADFQVRSYTAIRRHQALVNCTFCFCWAAWFAENPPQRWWLA